MDLIKVSSQSRTASVAGAIAGSVRANGRVEIQTIGAGSLNQAMKALVLARGYLKDDGFDVVYIPEFVDLDFDGRLVTAIKIIVEPR
ncbi:MAG: stage V sporulation protein S [Anaerolineaceae bacterium]|nr:stage V sporulation protein S [Anaerolineaceae bacterium]